MNKKVISSSKSSSEYMRRTFILILLCIIPGVLMIREVLDPDIWWHIQTGNWIFQNGALPDGDPFSRFGWEKSWMVYSWLFDLLVSWIYNAHGLVGIVLFKLAFCYLITWRLYVLFHELVPDFGKFMGIFVVTYFLLISSFTPRPWLFTILFFILELQILIQAYKTSNTKKLFWLIPIFILWANIHIQFIYGLFLLALFIFEPIILKKFGFESLLTSTEQVIPSKKLLLVFGLCFLGTLINPYHIQLYSVIWLYSGQSVIYPFIMELAPPSFSKLIDWVFLGTVLFFSGQVGWRKEKRPLTYLLLLFACYFSFKMKRDGWLLGLLAGVVISGFPSHFEEGKKYLFSKKQKILALGILIASLLITGWARNFSEKELQKALARKFPQKAINFIEKNQLSGPLFNDFDWGGFLIHRLSRLSVSIDGRTNVHGVKGFVRSLNTWNARPSWTKDKLLQESRLILAQKRDSLVSVLRLDKHFQVIYEDELSVVFVRK